MALGKMAELSSLVKNLKDAGLMVLIVFLLSVPVRPQQKLDGPWRMTEDHSSLPKEQPLCSWGGEEHTVIRGSDEECLRYMACSPSPGEYSLLNP